MQSIKSHRTIRWKWVVVIIVTLLVVCLAFVFFINNRSFAPSVNNNIVTKPKVPQTKLVSSDVLFLGNTFWGRYINDWSMASTLKYAYPFSRLNEFNRDQHNAWISGLECPTVAGVNMTSAEQEQALQFNCSPEYLSEAAKWYTAFTLANNHTDNQGIEGFTETKEQLEKDGIQYFGHYDPREINDICEVISLPVTVLKDNDSKAKGNLPIAICAYHGVFQIPPDESVAEIKMYSSYMPVIAMPHMGKEYQSSPDELKTSFYRSLIDGGADVVIGDHPHWIQTTESYDGHLIVYSMGNFMFDQQDTPEVVRSAGIKMVIKTSDKSDLINKWLAIGGSCKTYKDDCLAKIKKQKLSKLTIEYKFGVVGTNDGDKIVKPATEAQQASILERLNWQSTMNQLQSPYGSL